MILKFGTLFVGQLIQTNIVEVDLNPQGCLRQKTLSANTMHAEHITTGWILTSRAPYYEHFELL